MNNSENDLRLKIYIAMWVAFGIAFLLFGPVGFYLK